MRIPTSKRSIFVALTLLLVLSTHSFAEYETVEIDGVKWLTNSEFEPLGSPDAKKGGSLKTVIFNFVPTLRDLGPSANLTTISDIHSLTHETLLEIDPNTTEYLPRLASHWRISDDKKTFWFKLDPRARFSDGTPVTPDDVVASYEFVTNPDIKDPASRKLFVDYYEKPEVLEDGSIQVRCKVDSWRSLLYFSASMKIYPAREARMPGDVYLRNYNWKQLVGSGPYIIKDPETDIKDGEYIVLSRRDDYWRKDLPGTQYRFNFDQLRFVVVTDRVLAFQKLKAGELDYLQIGKAQRWVEETSDGAFALGHIQKVKAYNQQPNSFGGYMFNMRKWPFDDKQVRLAFCYAFNREKLFETFFFNEYEYIDSYYPGQVWANPDNRRIRYNPRQADRLLDRAGYTKRNADGVRVHETTGKALEIDFEYDTPSFERIHTAVAEDLMKVGIKLNLDEVDYNSLLERVGERKFLLSFRNWRGILFPNPITSWHSDLAHQQHNNNLTGFADPEVDELMKKYDATYDREEQIKYLREVDARVFKSYCTALAWYAPFTRLAYWDRYGMPETVISRIGDQSDTWAYWWFDPSKAAALEKARANGTPLPKREVISDPWGVRSTANESKPGSNESGALESPSSADKSATAASQR